MKTWSLRAIVFLLLLGMSSVAAVAIWGSSGKLPGGMSVSGWDIGGLTVSEFDAGLKEKVRALAAAKVTLRLASPGRAAEERTASLGELGLQLNADALRTEIASMSEGSLWEKAVRRWEWRGRELTLRVGLNKRVFEEKVQSMWPEIYSVQPVDARREITAYDTVKYVPGRTATRIETDALRQEVAYALEGAASGSVLVPGGADPESFVARRLFSSAVQPIAVDMPLFELEPEVTVESLRAEGVERLIAKFSTSFAASAEGRKHNVRSTAAVVNDTLLPPGGVFDYGKVIAETKKRFGFREAPVIFNGKLVPGIGGGICQVSTTLYNAVLRAGLEIVERRNHSLPIGYAPMGQDATFSSGYINFKWRNSTGKHLLIRTESEGGVLTVKLFGSTPKNVSYEIKSVTVKTIEPPVKYVKNPSLAKGTVKLLQQGKPGYVVETYRYKKVDGKVVGREKLSRDTYKAQPTLYASNAGGAAPGPGSSGSGSGIVEDGVMGPVFD
ncbi:VanW family protein [Paenibacillus alkalitolerans]|uniref:VanW family protein n=1 Tax=Paenibacillus alkalitolerans TaxID=2799335 RepID=UPI001F380795|nr:VanW family protein [Paenibacillus alkalitolerans]